MLYSLPVPVPLGPLPCAAVTIAIKIKPTIIERERERRQQHRLLNLFFSSAYLQGRISRSGREERRGEFLFSRKMSSPSKRREMDLMKL